MVVEGPGGAQGLLNVKVVGFGHFGFSLEWAKGGPVSGSGFFGVGFVIWSYPHSCLAVPCSGMPSAHPPVAKREWPPCSVAEASGSETWLRLA